MVEFGLSKVLGICCAAFWYRVLVVRILYGKELIGAASIQTPSERERHVEWDHVSGVMDRGGGCVLRRRGAGIMHGNDDEGRTHAGKGGNTLVL